MADPFELPLPPEVRKALGRRLGGYRKNLLHPDSARVDGAKGGKNTVKNHPAMTSSTHGRRLALSKRGRWYLAEAERLLEESEE